MELQKRLDKVFACKNLFYCSENERKEIKEYLIPAAFEYHLRIVVCIKIIVKK